MTIWLCGVFTNHGRGTGRAIGWNHVCMADHTYKDGSALLPCAARRTGHGVRLCFESSIASTSSATDYVFWKMTATLFMSSDGLKDVTYRSRDGGIER